MIGYSQCQLVIPMPGNPNDGSGYVLMVMADATVLACRIVHFGSECLFVVAVQAPFETPMTLN